MLIFDSPFLKIEHNEATQTIVEEWKLDFTTNVEELIFREPLEKLLSEFKALKATKWLSDNTEQKNLSSADQLWLETHFYPELVKNGLQKAASVNAKNIMNTGLAKNQIQNLSENKVIIEIFNKKVPAQNWLKS